MERKNSERLSAMEKTQAETNRRLEDVLQSNMSLQSMLQSVLINMSRSNAGETCALPRTSNTAIGGTSGNVQVPCDHGVLNPSGIGSSKNWWDNLCKTSDDEAELNNG